MDKQEYFIDWEDITGKLMRATGPQEALEGLMVTHAFAPGVKITVRQRSTNEQWGFIIGRDAETQERYVTPDTA